MQRRTGLDLGNGVGKIEKEPVPARFISFLARGGPSVLNPSMWRRSHVAKARAVQDERERAARAKIRPFLVGGGNRSGPQGGVIATNGTGH